MAAGRARLPVPVAPMLATPGRPPPQGTGYSVEIKWDGARAIAVVTGGELRLFSRNQRPITHSYPELADLPALLRGSDASWTARSSPCSSPGSRGSGCSADSAQPQHGTRATPASARCSIACTRQAPR
jgi:hypothetical protein